MTKHVDFYFSVGSRYSYLASTQMAKLEAVTGCRVEWHPIDHTMLVKRGDHDPFRGGSPASGQYRWPYREHDAMAWAEYYGVPYREPRNRVTFEPMPIALACTAAKRMGQGVAFSQQMLAAMFVDPTEKIDEAEISRRARTCGLVGDAFAAECRSAETAAQLEKTVDAAFRAGAFGVPSFVVDDELFWGNDRLVLVRHRLLNGQSRQH